MKFCLFVDTECDFYKKIPSPHFSCFDYVKWYLNKFRGALYRYPRGRSGLIAIVAALKKLDFPAAFNIVGHLYLKSCSGHPHFDEEAPGKTWFFKIWFWRPQWFYWDPKSTYHKAPGFYLGDFIETELKVSDKFTLGLHGFMHEAFTLEDASLIKKNLDAGIKSAKKLGVEPFCFDGPFNMLEDVASPSKIFDILKSLGIKLVFYAGSDSGFDKRARSYDKKKPFDRFGVRAIHISNYLEGTQSKAQVDAIIKDIENTVTEDVVYCLGTHDFTHKNSANLERVLLKVMDLETQGKLEIVSVRDLV